MYTLSFKVGRTNLFGHDCSVVLARNGEIIHGVEDERFSRKKHGSLTFPGEAIKSCLDSADLDLADVDEVILPYDPGEQFRSYRKNLAGLARSSVPMLDKLKTLERLTEVTVRNRFRLTDAIRTNLQNLGEPVPEITTMNHHRAHAVSTHYLSDSDLDLVVTADARGEVDATVIWRVDNDGLLRREHTFNWPNSLGTFYGAITEYLGYRANNGEGKVMGLAPYGANRKEFIRELESRLDFSADYNVTPLTKGLHISDAVDRLESWFGRPARQHGDPIEEWHKDVAAVAQQLLESVTVELVSEWCEQFDARRVGLSGGIALNCKMNKRIREMSIIDDLFVQPVAGDSGLALGGALSAYDPDDVSPMETVYWGPKYSSETIEAVLSEVKFEYNRPTDLYKKVAMHLANGDLVGWFQGRLEMGPRALGHRSILADPRTIESRDRVNEFVKHREEWRPFAPSILESAVEDYFVDATTAPYMIQTFDVRSEKAREIPAVLHPEDLTARPQTVSESNNPRYYRLISAFESITSVPVLLNTSFNDSGEPIVNRPREALRDFAGMGLDVLVLEDFLITK